VERFHSIKTSLSPVGSTSADGEEIYSNCQPHHLHLEDTIEETEEVTTAAANGGGSTDVAKRRDDRAEYAAVSKFLLCSTHRHRLKLELV